MQRGLACSCTAAKIDPECALYKKEQARLEVKPLLSKSKSKPRVPPGYVLEPVPLAAVAETIAEGAGASASAQHATPAAEGSGSRHAHATLAAELQADTDLGFKLASKYVLGPILRSTRKSSDQVRT